MGYTTANFRSRLAAGNKTEQYVAEKLAEVGVTVVKPEYPAGLPTKFYTENQVDLIANDQVLEIKGRNLQFNNTEDYPYPTIFVEGKPGFDQKKFRPKFYLTVSNKSGAVIALDVDETFDRWTSEPVTDRFRQHTMETYVSRREDWIGFDELLRRLNERSGN